ncbi:hypothetical protein WA026_008812, partial [Henosepilachna vigintioctopunctata]
TDSVKKHSKGKVDVYLLEGNNIIIFLKISKSQMSMDKLQESVLGFRPSSRKTLNYDEPDDSEAQSYMIDEVI